MAYTILIVSASGAVGVEFLKVLRRSNSPVGVRLLATKRSAGRERSAILRFRRKNANGYAL